MEIAIAFSEDKNEWLKSARGVCFEDVAEAIQNDEALADAPHPSPKHPNQRIYVVEINNYVYAVPYVVNEEKQEIFLKTIYPSRQLQKRYGKGGKK